MRMIVAGNPVGEVKQVEAVDVIVKSLITQWTEENPKPQWWKFWGKGHIVYKATRFILDALDILIIAVEKELASGPEKKAAVLAACAFIYDFIVANALPLWAKPFSSKIRAFIIYVLIATAIDWMVEKYRNGLWKQPEEPTNGQEKVPTEEKPV
jgi:hypothetical protein